MPTQAPGRAGVRVKCARCGKVRDPSQMTPKRVCRPCRRVEDEGALKKGRITMLLVPDAQGRWYAVSLGGRIRFPLLRRDGQTVAQQIGSPFFKDKQGMLWGGRFYPPSGTAHFKRPKGAKPPTPAGVRKAHTTTSKKV